MNISHAFRLTILSAAILLALATPQLQAQQSTAEADVEVLQVRGSRLDSAATATGLPLTLRETPQSVSIIDDSFISAFSLDSVADIMALAPGIQAQQAETNRYFFRARGNAITNFQFDGVPVQYSSFFNEAVTDSILFDRIELVRGASGLLSGAGEPSAAINLIRKRPKAEPAGYASVKLGSRDSVRLEADQSLNLTDDGAVQARFAAAYEQFDSYVDLAKEDKKIKAQLETATAVSKAASSLEAERTGGRNSARAAPDEESRAALLKQAEETRQQLKQQTLGIGNKDQGARSLLSLFN